MPPDSQFQWRIAKLSDVGRARDHQEDAVDVMDPPDSSLFASKGHLLIVADGMGGHNAGEVASQTALSEIQRVYFSDADADVLTSLTHALQAANTAVYDLSLTDEARSGMGTTAVVAVLRDRRVNIANIGDSRVYVVRDGHAVQISRDHSWVADQVRAGKLTSSQARTHPQRNLITRAIGASGEAEPDFFRGELELNDALVLCSDGLTGYVTDAELANIVSKHVPEESVQLLVDLANERGGGDNISVIVARVEALPVQEQNSSPADSAVPPSLLGKVSRFLFST